VSSLAQLPVFRRCAAFILAVYRSRDSGEEPSRLRAYSKAKRMTYLAVLCFLSAQESIDGFVNLLVHIVHIIDVRAQCSESVIINTATMHEHILIFVRSSL
jgi:hypothetical protein